MTRSLEAAILCPAPSPPRRPCRAHDGAGFSVSVLVDGKPVPEYAGPRPDLHRGPEGQGVHDPPLQPDVRARRRRALGRRAQRRRRQAHDGARGQQVGARPGPDRRHPGLAGFGPDGPQVLLHRDARSYAAWLGDTSNVGMIEAVFFREKRREPTPSCKDEPAARAATRPAPRRAGRRRERRLGQRAARRSGPPTTTRPPASASGPASPSSGWRSRKTRRPRRGSPSATSSGPQLVRLGVLPREDEPGLRPRRRPRIRARIRTRPVRPGAEPGRIRLRIASARAARRDSPLTEPERTDEELLASARGGRRGRFRSLRAPSHRDRPPLDGARGRRGRRGRHDPGRIRQGVSRAREFPGRCAAARLARGDRRQRRQEPLPRPQPLPPGVRRQRRRRSRTWRPRRRAPAPRSTRAPANRGASSRRRSSACRPTSACRSSCATSKNGATRRSRSPSPCPWAPSSRASRADAASSRRSSLRCSPEGCHERHDPSRAVRRVSLAPPRRRASPPPRRAPSTRIAPGAPRAAKPPRRSRASLAAFRSRRRRRAAADLSARILRKIRAQSPSRRPFGVMFGIDVRWAGVFVAALLVVLISAPAAAASPRRAPPVGAPRDPGQHRRCAPASETGSAGGSRSRSRAGRCLAEGGGPGRSRAQARDEATRRPRPLRLPPSSDGEARKARRRAEAPRVGRAFARRASDAAPRTRRRMKPAPGHRRWMRRPSAILPSAVRALDGQGSSARPNRFSRAAAERLAPLRGGAFVIVVETGPRAAFQSSSRRHGRAAEAARRQAPAVEALRALRFAAGRPAPRLLVRVE